MEGYIAAKLAEAAERRSAQAAAAESGKRYRGLGASSINKTVKTRATVVEAAVERT